MNLNKVGPVFQLVEDDGALQLTIDKAESLSLKSVSAYNESQSQSPQKRISLDPPFNLV